METGLLSAAAKVRRCGWWLALATICIASWQARAAEPEAGVDEYRAKAAFIYNFCKFVGWPGKTDPGPGKPFVVAVVDRPAMAAVMARELKGKRIGGRAVLVREFARLRDVRGVRVAYASVGNMKELRRSQREGLERDSVLLVGDGQQFLELGGVLALEIRDERLSFEVNIGAARRAQLELSANLLGLAVAVVDR